MSSFIFFQKKDMGDGRDVCVDVSIANSYKNDHVVNRAFDPMEPINEVVNRKNEKYRTRCHDAGYAFVPFVCGSLGGYNDAAVNLIKDMGKRLGIAWGIPKSLAIARMRQWISFSIQKSQANSWLKRAEEAGGVYNTLSL
jgi:hypothetical protein